MENIVNDLLQKFDDKLTNAVKGLASYKEVSDVKSEIQTQIKSMAAAEVAEVKNELVKIVEKNNELLKTIEKQGNEIAKLKEGRGQITRKGFRDYVKQFLGSEDYQKFAERPHGRTAEFSIPSDAIHQKTVSLTSDWTSGTAIITQDLGDRISEPNRPLNMRDIMTARRTSKRTFAFAKVTNWVWAVSMEGENTSLDESSFDVVETDKTCVRLGTFVDISKSMLNDAMFVESIVNTDLLARMRYTEDFQILYGDGGTNQIDGLCKNARSFDLTPTTYTGGDFASVATYKSGTQSLITFAAAHGLFGGYQLTIANSSNYNGTYDVIVVSQTQVLIDKAYQAETATGWTGSGTHPDYQAIASANEADVLNVAAATLTAMWYKPTAIVLNPLTANKIKRLLKSSTYEYLMPVIDLPIIETDAMPAGKFLVGDFARAVALVDYQDATIYAASDVSYAKMNKVAIIAEEMLNIALYNSYFLMYGDFTDAITELNDPSA